MVCALTRSLIAGPAVIVCVCVCSFADDKSKTQEQMAPEIIRAFTELFFIVENLAEVRSPHQREKEGTIDTSLLGHRSSLSLRSGASHKTYW